MERCGRSRHILRPPFELDCTHVAGEWAFLKQSELHSAAPRGSGVKGSSKPGKGIVHQQELAASELTWPRFYPNDQFLRHGEPYISVILSPDSPTRSFPVTVAERLNSHLLPRGTGDRKHWDFHSTYTGPESQSVSQWLPDWLTDWLTEWVSECMK